MLDKKWALVLASAAVLVIAVVSFLNLDERQTKNDSTSANQTQPPAKFGQYKAENIPQTGVDTFQSLPSDNYHVSMRRGRCNTMYQHLQRLKSADLDSDDYRHARHAIALLAGEMIGDFTSETGMRNDSRASASVWSDSVGFLQSREHLSQTLSAQAQLRQANESVNKTDEINQIIEACSSCHKKYTVSEGRSLPTL